jgi:trimethylamine--corrinoid protein Co-methyltransferase
MCQRVLRGIEVTDETLAADLMIEKGPGKDYIADEHTVRHMRGEFFMPTLANRDKRESMEPGSDALSRAKAFVKAVRERPRESRLPPDVRAEVLAAHPEIRDV